MNLLEKAKFYVETFTRHKSLTLAFLDTIDIVDRRIGSLFLHARESVRKDVIATIRKRGRPNVANVQGHKMYLDQLDSMNLSILGIYEPTVTEIFKKEVKNGDVVLDIGAHIGYYTLISAKLVGEKGHVFAFEPNPTNFNLLEKNVKANGYKNVTLVQKAVSNKTGKTKLYSDEKIGSSSIFDPNSASKVIEVDVIRLDDYFKDYNREIDFIKMDIEGAEPLAVQGMPFLLQKNSNVKIITEFSPVAIKKAGSKPEEYLESLIKHGFRLYNLDRKIEPVAIEKLLQMIGENHTNLLCEKRT